MRYFFVSYVITGKEKGYGTTVMQSSGSLFNRYDFVEDLKPLIVTILSFQEITRQQAYDFLKEPNYKPNFDQKEN